MKMYCEKCKDGTPHIFNHKTGKYVCKWCLINEQKEEDRKRKNRISGN